MANKESKIKEKMLDALERAIEDPHLIDDKEWSRLFGAASLARAMSIVSKLKGRPADDAETLAENHSPLTKEEKEMLIAWLQDGYHCKCCNKASLRSEKQEDTMPAA